MSEKNRPEKTFRAGAISATVWKNKSTKDGEDVYFYNITLKRSYKDKEGNWKNTDQMRINDLPKASLVLNKAYESLVLADPDAKSSVSESAYEEEDIVM